MSYGTVCAVCAISTGGDKGPRLSCYSGQLFRLLHCWIVKGDADLTVSTKTCSMTEHSQIRGPK